MVSGPTRVREKDLVKPVLELIVQYGHPKNGLEISRIQAMLRQIISLSDDDKATLSGRTDDRFSQVVRNLVSHRTLEKQGLAEYKKGLNALRGVYVITPKGRALVSADKPMQLDLFGCEIKGENNVP